MSVKKTLFSIFTVLLTELQQSEACALLLEMAQHLCSAHWCAHSHADGRYQRPSDRTQSSVGMQSQKWSGLRMAGPCERKRRQLSSAGLQVRDAFNAFFVFLREICTDVACPLQIFTALPDAKDAMFGMLTHASTKPPDNKAYDEWTSQRSNIAKQTIDSALRMARSATVVVSVENHRRCRCAVTAKERCACLRQLLFWTGAAPVIGREAEALQSALRMCSYRIAFDLNAPLLLQRCHLCQVSECVLVCCQSFSSVARWRQQCC